MKIIVDGQTAEVSGGVSQEELDAVAETVSDLTVAVKQVQAEAAQAKAAAEAAQTTANNAMPKSGGTITGPLNVKDGITVTHFEAGIKIPSSNCLQISEEIGTGIYSDEQSVIRIAERDDNTPFIGFLQKGLYNSSYANDNRIVLNGVATPTFASDAVPKDYVDRLMTSGHKDVWSDQITVVGTWFGEPLYRKCVTHTFSKIFHTNDGNLLDFNFDTIPLDLTGDIDDIDAAADHDIQRCYLVQATFSRSRPSRRTVVLSDPVYRNRAYFDDIEKKDCFGVEGVYLHYDETDYAIKLAAIMDEFTSLSPYISATGTAIIAIEFTDQ